MSLFSDVTDDIQELWKSSSYITRIFLGISMFLSISSVTSLADVVLKWKGFILDGVEFYRAWIPVPLRDLASRIGLEWSSVQADTFVVVVVIVTALTRGYMVIVATWVRPVGLGAWMLYLIIWLLIYLIQIALFGIGLNIFESYWGLVVLVLFLYVIGSISGMVDMTRFGWNIARKFFLAFYGSVLITVFVICVLGAINAGLSANVR